MALGCGCHGDEDPMLTQSQHPARIVQEQVLGRHQVYHLRRYRSWSSSLRCLLASVSDGLPLRSQAVFIVSVWLTLCDRNKQ